MTETGPIHASCVVFGMRGVLILGEPGCGKSSLALDLIERGAMLVADDYLHVEAAEGGVRALPAVMLAGLIEVRGLGVVRRPWRRSCMLQLVVRLGGERPARLPRAETTRIAGVALPAITLAPHAAGNARVVELALSVRGHPLMSPA